jgi:hypothetical protein
LAGRFSVHVTTPSARSTSNDSMPFLPGPAASALPTRARYRSGVGFNPFRQQVKRRSDIVLVVSALVVVALVVLWAALPR